jgi:hypothetical protein
VPGGAYCDVDGAAVDESVLEGYAHHGEMIWAHKKKVTDGALKLVTLARTRPGVRLIVALTDHVVRPLLGCAAARAVQRGGRC